MELFASVPLLIIDDLGMRKLPVTAAAELLEIVMRRYERTRMSEPVLCSRQIDPSTTGANCWVTAQPSPPCSIASSIRVMFSNAVREVGAGK
jgi:hypothetical protein